MCGSPKENKRTKIGGSGMHTKTMEGLIGARTNMNLVNTPMRVYKEARRKGDLGAMERAMGYACDFAGRAEEYKEVADEGMKKESEEAKEKEKLELEEELEKKREERRNPDGNDSSVPAADSAALREPVLYTSAGTAKPVETKPSISISM